MSFLAIEIGGTKLQLAIGDDSATVLDRRRFDVDRALGAAGIQRQIEAALPEVLERWRPARVAVGFGGPVDGRAGRISRSHQIAGWSNFDLRGWLQSLTGLAVVVDNDANMAALGEALRGAGQGFNPVFYITLGSGVGGGLVAGGTIYHGAPPGECEIGHVRLDREGTILEARCSGWAVDAKLRRLKESDPTGLLARLLSDPPGGEAKYLAAALGQNDATAGRLLAETAEELAFGLSHVVHLLHPEVIVLGGGLSLLGEPWRAAVARAVPRFVMDVFRPGPSIRLAALGEEAVPVGCLCAARLAGPGSAGRELGIS